GIAAEVRSPGGIDGRNPRQSSARCEYPIELVSRRKMLLGAGRAGTLHDHDARAIGGPDRRIEERAVGREARGPAAGSRSDLVQRPTVIRPRDRSEEHTSELQSRGHLVCRLLLEKKK